MSHIAQKIHALTGMNISQLRRCWKELFGEVATSRNKVFLRRRLAWRMQSLAEGSLTERALRRAEELARDADLRIRAPRDCCTTDPTRTVVVAMPERDPRLPAAGTVLLRDFKGRRLAVTVLQEGFEFEGKTWPSLSAIAKEVTGTRWNGFIFFGLQDKKGTKHA